MVEFKAMVEERELPKKQDIDTTLKERGNQYGEFKEHARITQNIKKAMKGSPNWQHLTASMKESLEMVAHKMGRILNGNPEYLDSWHDIIGYIRLVEQELEQLHWNEHKLGE